MCIFQSFVSCWFNEWWIRFSLETGLTMLYGLSIHDGFIVLSYLYALKKRNCPGLTWTLFVREMSKNNRTRDSRKSVNNINENSASSCVVQIKANNEYTNVICRWIENRLLRNVIIHYQNAYLLKISQRNVQVLCVHSSLLFQK